MLITRKSPFQAELSWLEDEMNRVFGLETRETRTIFEPHVTIWEQDDKVLLEMELPGFAQEDVNIEILPTGVVSIQGERSFGDQDNAQHVYGYRRYGKLQKEYKLPNSIDSDSIDAKLINGMLTITLRKQAKAKARKINLA